MKFITSHHTQGVLFYDPLNERRYVVQKDSIHIDYTDGTRDYREVPSTFYGLTEGDSTYFQLSLIYDDIDALIHISNQFIDGVEIETWQIIRSTPQTLHLRLNGSLELVIDRDNGIYTMPGLPNEKELHKAWVKGTVMDIMTVLNTLGIHKQENNK
ncbi:TPA: hypothetical protein N4630_000096 [Shigella boydii]|nr:hypothetical protein [Shigella sonnei]HBD6759233.1 hypothetical protein [Shigella sonnei]HCM8577957.1 hypothetical protein [Shigella boydii]